MTAPPPSLLRRLFELAALFFRLGLIAFGGPAAHVALMREEVVDKRKWIDEQHFLDLLGATYLIPGPNSSEMAIHTGYVYAGFPGMIVAGISWMLPAFFIVLILSWAYVHYSATPTAQAMMAGIKPVIIPIIVLALWRLGQRAVKGWLTAAAGVITVLLYFLDVNLLLILLVVGVAVMVIDNLRRGNRPDMKLLAGGIFPTLAAAAALPFSLGLMFLTFVKIGLVLYGGGYTLFAFLQDDFVERLGWLTEQQLIDAVAVGQMTPGPLFTTTTFIGYLLGTMYGTPPILTATLATLGFYLPSFVLVAISNPLIPHIRNSQWASGFLDGVNVAALGAMAAVTFQLGRAAFIDLPTVLIGLVAGVLLFRFEINSVWLVIGGAVVGLGMSVLGG